MIWFTESNVENAWPIIDETLNMTMRLMTLLKTSLCFSFFFFFFFKNEPIIEFKKGENRKVGRPELTQKVKTEPYSFQARSLSFDSEVNVKIATHIGHKTCAGTTRSFPGCCVRRSKNVSASPKKNKK